MRYSKEQHAYKYLYLQLEAPLAGTDELVRCSVKLTGSSVLQGVKQCIISDLITLPVPTVLSALHSSGSNSVLLQCGSIEHSLIDPSRSDDKENEPLNKI